MDGALCLLRYMAECRPLPLPAPWDTLTVDPDAYLGPLDPCAAVARFADAHTAQQLVESGLIVPAASGSMLNPQLAAAEDPLIVLRDLATGSIINLLTAEGCLLRPRVPLFAALRDRTTFKSLARNGKQLLLTGNLLDTVLLRSLGYAAAPICGLENLGEGGIELFRELCGVLDAAPGERWSPSVASSADRDLLGPYHCRAAYRLPGDGPLADCRTPNCCELVVVGWTMHALALSQPQVTRRVLDQLAAVARITDRSVMDCDMWTPSEEHLRQLTSALERGELGWAADCLSQSLELDVQSLMPRCDMDPSPGRPTAMAPRDGTTCDSSDTSRAQSSRSAAEERQREQSELTLSLRQELANIRNPVERVRYGQLVDLQLLFSRRSAAAHAKPVAEVNHRDVQDLLALNQEIATLSKEMLRCTRSRPARNG